MIQAISRVAFCALILLMSACAADRTPLPVAQLNASAPYGIEGDTRYWGDTIQVFLQGDNLQRLATRIKNARADDLAQGEPVQQNILALSGGGADGAFGAGLINGWTKSGTRPVFDIVTGISTGSIIGLLAFLGPDYDDELKTFYTSYSTRDLLRPAPLKALFGGRSITKTKGYYALVDAFVDDEVVTRLARAAREGRILMVGTTNLDAARPVVWDLTYIAASDHPDAKRLIRDLIKASSAIPAVFPPVLVPVTTPDGRQFDELHVDGAATQQVMLFSPELPIKQVDAAVGLKVDRTLYILMNNAVQQPYAPVNPNVGGIISKTVASIVSGSGGSDIYKLYAMARRDEVDFNVTWIPQSFDQEKEEPFDLAYMRALYDIGYQYGLTSSHWRKYPPNFDPGP